MNMCVNVYICQCVIIFNYMYIYEFYFTVDVDVDVDELDEPQTNFFNTMATNYGMANGDYIS